MDVDREGCLKFTRWREYTSLAAIEKRTPSERESSDDDPVRIDFSYARATAAGSNGVRGTLMAGQLSARDLAAVALGSALWMPTYLFFMGVCMAVSPIVSHLTGAKACEQLGSYIRRTLLLAAALSAVWWWLLRSADLIVLRLDVSSAIQDLSLAYLHALA